MSGEFKRSWLVLTAATLGTSLATTAIPFYTIGVFVSPLEEAKGWSRTDISLAITLFGFALPLSMLAAGNFIERFGASIVVASGHLVLGAVFIALSFVGSSVRSFWALYLVAALLAVGASPIAFTRVLVTHFDRHRGLAMGICMSGAGLGAAVLPPLLGTVIATHGWAAGYRVLGALTLCLIPVALLWLREGPAHGISGVRAASPKSLTESEWNVHPTLLITLIAVVFFSIALSVNGFIVHLIPMMIDSGIDATKAAWIGGNLGVAVILSRLIAGYLLDKVPVGLLAMAVMALAAMGVLLLDLSGAKAASVAALLIGFTVGAEVDLAAYMVSRMFRPADYTRNFSRVYGSFILGSGLSPLIAGWVADRYGTYVPFIRASCALLLLIALAFLFMHLGLRRATCSMPPVPGKQPL